MFVASLLLATAITIEVSSTALLPRTQGFTAPGWTLAVLGGYVLSLWLLTLVTRQMPVSTAYAIWSGAGTALVAVAGVAFLGEQLDALKWGALALIVAGVVLLNLAPTATA